MECLYGKCLYSTFGIHIVNTRYLKKDCSQDIMIYKCLVLLTVLALHQTVASTTSDSESTICAYSIGSSVI